MDGIELKVHIPLASDSHWWGEVDELEEMFGLAVDELASDAISESEEEGGDLCFYMSGLEIDVLAQVARRVLTEAGLLEGAWAELVGDDGFEDEGKRVPL